MPNLFLIITTLLLLAIFAIDAAGKRRNHH
jgi:hypothetical protein